MGKDVRYLQIPLRRCAGDTSILMELSEAFQKEGYEIVASEGIIMIKKEESINTPPLIDEESVSLEDK